MPKLSSPFWVRSWRYLMTNYLMFVNKSDELFKASLLLDETVIMCE